MLKLLSGIAIITFTTFCGYLFAQKYRKRKLFFAQLREFNERFLSEIAYYRLPIGEFIASFSYQKEFEILLKEFFLNIETRSVNDLGIFDLPEYAFLTKEEKGIVQDYFLMIGKGDSASQKAYFSSVKDKLLKLQTDSENNCKRYNDLYIKIGFLCGLLILILII